MTPFKALVGKTIKSVRKSTAAEMRHNGFHSPYSVIVFTDNSKLYALGDEEGNYPGMMILNDKGKEYYVLG